MPLLHSGPQRSPKIFHLMCHQMPFWCGFRCKTFLENYGRGCAWAVPEVSEFSMDCLQEELMHLIWGVWGLSPTFSKEDRQEGNMMEIVGNVEA